MTRPVLDEVRDLLKAHDASFREIEHGPTYTSEESARARGEDLRTGAKAILAKTDEIFRMFILPAHMKINTAAVKREFSCKKFRFATREELLTLTGLVPGSVPPFGEPLFPVALYCDPEVGAAEGRVAFNAGSLTVSIVMSAEDWYKAAKPTPCHIAEEA
jgi:Ala-tRNA(Pro) deacylase